MAETKLSPLRTMLSRGPLKSRMMLRIESAGTSFRQNMMLPRKTRRFSGGATGALLAAVPEPVPGAAGPEEPHMSATRSAPLLMRFSVSFSSLQAKRVVSLPAFDMK